MITRYREKDTGKAIDDIHTYIDERITADRYQSMLDDDELVKVGPYEFLQGRALRLLDPIQFEYDRSVYADQIAKDLLSYGDAEDFAEYGLEVIEEED